jgi:hypothetical protein
LGLGVLASDGRRVVRVDLTPAQARELERDPDVFTDPARLLERLGADEAYRSSDVTTATTGPATTGPATTGPATADGLPVRPRRAQAGGTGRADRADLAAGDAAPDEAVREAVAELGRLATRVAQLAGDRPPSEATRRALEEVEQRIARLDAQVDPAGRPRGPAVTGPPQDRARLWRARARMLSVTRPTAPRRPDAGGGIGAQLKSVADALRASAASPPAAPPPASPAGPDADRDRAN